MKRHDGRAKPPGPDGLPLLGNTYEYVRDPFSFITHCAREYGDVTSYEVAGRPFYQLDHPADIEHSNTPWSPTTQITSKASSSSGFSGWSPAGASSTAKATFGVASVT